MTAEFALALTLFITGAGADLRTTDLALQRGGMETNPLMGAHPSDSRLYGIGAIGAAGVGLYASHLYKTHPKRAVWLLIGAGVLHGALAEHNSHIGGE